VTEKTSETLFNNLNPILMKKFIYLLVLTPAFLNNGCSSLTLEVQTMELMIARDVSKSVGDRCFPLDTALFNNILSIIELTDDVVYFEKGIECSFSYIGADYRPLVSHVTLEPGSHVALDNIRSRKKKIAIFKSQLLQAAHQLMQMPSDHASTFINSSLCYQFEVMRESSFSNDHRLILMTDGIQEGEGVNFVAQPIAPESYEEITRQLNEQCAFGDLSTFDITILACPPEGLTEASYASTAYWLLRFKEAGASARIRSNL